MAGAGRREFLKGAGAGIAALTLDAGAAGAQEKRKVVVGIIGRGGQGRHHLEEMARREGVEGARVCDPDRTHLGMAGDSVKTVTGPTPKAGEDLRRLPDDPPLGAAFHAPTA